MKKRKGDRMDWLEAVLVLGGLGIGVVVTLVGRRMIAKLRSWRRWKQWNRERRPVADKGPFDRHDEQKAAEKPDPKKVKPLTKKARNNKIWKTWNNARKSG
jgi:hypothetical protein